MPRLTHDAPMRHSYLPVRLVRFGPDECILLYFSPAVPYLNLPKSLVTPTRQLRLPNRLAKISDSLAPRHAKTRFSEHSGSRSTALLKRASEDPGSPKIPFLVESRINRARGMEAHRGRRLLSYSSPRHLFGVAANRRRRVFASR